MFALQLILMKRKLQYLLLLSLPVFIFSCGPTETEKQRKSINIEKDNQAVLLNEFQASLEDFIETVSSDSLSETQSIALKQSLKRIENSQKALEKINPDSVFATEEELKDYLKKSAHIVQKTRKIQFNQYQMLSQKFGFELTNPPSEEDLEKSVLNN